MKSLSKALDNTLNTANPRESLIKMLSDGQETADGKMIIQSAQPLVNHQAGLASVRKQALSIQSLMREKKPKKCYDGKMRREELDNGNTINYYRQYTWKGKELTEHEQVVVDHSLLACPKETIIDLITRYVAMHKEHWVLGEDKRLITYADYADYLYGLPEYAITLGVMDIIANPKMDRFPTVAKIQQAAEDNLIKWPKNMEPGEELLR